MKYLGIYAYINPRSERMFGELNNVLLHLVTKGPKFDLNVFVFDADGFRGLGKTIVGYSHTNGKWTRGQFPFPHVIYNRHLDYKLSEKGLRIKRELEQSNIPFFNEHFGHKLKVQRRLEGMNGFKDKLYFPWTATYKGKSHLKQAMKRFPELYVKPKSGTQGKGVLKIESEQRRVYLNNKSHDFTDVDSLVSFVDQKVTDNYLVQEGIKIRKVDGKLVDLRVLVQNNGVKWETLAIMARLGAKGKHVTNIHQGGSALGYEELAQRINVPDKETIVGVSASIGKLLSRDANIAELGLDFLIDVNGRLCFVEANPRPGRRLLRLLGKDSIREKSLEYLLRYAKSLVEV